MTELETAYDSTSPSDIPAHAENLLCYIDGHYPNNAKEARARFPHATIKTITLRCTPGADIVDIEPGAVWPPLVGATYIKNEKRAGRHTTAYCSEGVWEEVKAAMHHAGVDPPYLIAAYPGIGPHLYPGSIGHQYLSPGIPGAETAGHYDVSVVDPDWMHGRTKPVPPKVKDLRPGTRWLLRRSIKVSQRITRRLDTRLKGKNPVPEAGKQKLHAAHTAMTEATDAISKSLLL